MESNPGTYALIFLGNQSVEITVGKLGMFKVSPGTYIYIGSAFGPGGLQSRISHHRKQFTVKHWHIDYLKPMIQLEQIWYTCDPVPREHTWAQVIGSFYNATIPLNGFGSSDCRCPSHLFYFPRGPVILEFQERLATYLNETSILSVEQL